MTLGEELVRLANENQKFVLVLLRENRKYRAALEEIAAARGDLDPDYQADIARRALEGK